MQSITGDPSLRVHFQDSGFEFGTWPLVNTRLYYCAWTRGKDRYPAIEYSRSISSLFQTLAEKNPDTARWLLGKKLVLDNSFQVMLQLADLGVIPFRSQCARLATPDTATPTLIMNETDDRNTWLELMKFYGWLRCGGIVEPPTFIHENYPPELPKFLG